VRFSGTLGTTKRAGCHIPVRLPFHASWVTLLRSLPQIPPLIPVRPPTKALPPVGLWIGLARQALRRVSSATRTWRHCNTVAIAALIVKWQVSKWCRQLQHKLCCQIYTCFNPQCARLGDVLDERTFVMPGPTERVSSSAPSSLHSTWAQSTSAGVPSVASHS